MSICQNTRKEDVKKTADGGNGVGGGGGGGEEKKGAENDEKNDIPFKIEKHKKRKNGFSCPPNCSQLLPPFCIFVNLLVYFWYLLPYIYGSKNSSRRQSIDIAAVILSAISLVALLFLIYFGIRASQVDAEDDVIKV